MAKKDVTKPISLDPRGGRPREKCVTYIEGIDRILNGGLPIGNIVLLAGTVGSGKTTLAMEYLINGAKNGETCCYISVTEPSSKMLSNLQTYGFFDDALVKDGRLNIFDLTVINDRLGVERLDFPLLVGNELERLGFPRMLASPAITMGERLVGVNIDDKVPLEVASRAGDRPMYLVHGDSDVRISNEHSKKFYDKAVEAEANVTLWLVEDSAHVDALWEYSSEYESRIVTFFTDSLIIES